MILFLAFAAGFTADRRWYVPEVQIVRKNFPIIVEQLEYNQNDVARIFWNWFISEI